MKGKVGKKFSLKKTPRTGLTIHAVMGRLNTKPENVRTRKHHGNITHITKELEEKYYEYQHQWY